MKRETLLALIRVAGYHEHTKAGMRLFVENRISRQAYDTAFGAGRLERKNGMLKGEFRQLRNGRTGLLCRKLECDAPKYFDGENPPAANARYVPFGMTGEGKARDFAAARSCAIWPDATDEQLSLPEAELTALLESRLPALIAEFRADMESIGFLWEAPARGEA